MSLKLIQTARLGLMVASLSSITTYADGSIKVEKTLPPDVLPLDNLYRSPHDIERYNINNDNLDYISSTSVRGKVRQVVLDKNVPLPEVYRISPFHSVLLTEKLQLLWKGINPEISGEKWATLLGYWLAWCNGSGFGDANDPRADYVNRKNLSYKLPAFDQVRCCGGTVFKGTENNGIVSLEYIQASSPPSIETVMNSPWLWYWGASVAPKGTINLITRKGLDGTMKPVRIPIIASQQIYLPSSELHKLPSGSAIPSPTWTHYV